MRARAKRAQKAGRARGALCKLLAFSYYTNSSRAKRPELRTGPTSIRHRQLISRAAGLSPVYPQAPAVPMVALRRPQPLRLRRGTTTRRLPEPPRGRLVLRPGAWNQASAVWVPVGLTAPAVGHHSRRKIIGYDPALVMGVRVRARSTKVLIPKGSARRWCSTWFAALGAPRQGRTHHPLGRPCKVP